MKPQPEQANTRPTWRSVRQCQPASFFARAVTQRTHEIGVRTALGARTAEVIRLVVGEGPKLTAIGLCVGVFGALAVARTLSGFLYGVAPTDSVTLVLVGLLLPIVALLASYVPAHRAVSLTPTVALRAE